MKSETVVKGDIDNQRENFQKRLAQRSRSKNKSLNRLSIKSKSTLSFKLEPMGPIQVTN